MAQQTNSANTPRPQVTNKLTGAVQRAAVRLAILSLVVTAGGGAMWWGLKYLPAAKPAAAEGPTKQVVTGVKKSADGKVQPVGATLTDAQVPQPPVWSGQAAITPSSMSLAPKPTAYGGVSDAPPTSAAVTTPATSPYLPANNDLAGSYTASSPGRSPYAGAGEASRGSPPEPQLPATSAAVPSDPVQPPASAEPSNPYRSAADAGAAVAMPDTAPGQSPYAAVPPSASAAQGAAVSESQPASAPVAEAAPAADAASGYASRFNGGAGASPYSPPPTASPPATLPAASVPPISIPAASATIPQPLSSPPAAAPLATPPNSLPAAELANSPYAAVTTPGMRSPNINSASGGKLAAPTPGERQLEGPQQPAITLEKVSPAEIQVGKPAVFELYVRNAGKVPAQNVVISDHVPAGTQLQGAKPPPQQGADGSLVWNLGTMQPGEETQIVLEVIPQSEGEIGSTAHVTFAAAATSRSICTRPQLTIEHTAPPKVLIGEMLTVGITISNPGSGPATGVTIEEDVPDGLAHAAGAQLEYEVGTLRPGESKRLELSLRAQKAGIVQNTIIARGDANLAAQHAVQIEVVAPQLQVDVEGPKRKYLERQATYTVQVANPGTATAREVQLMAALPRGMKFVAADSQGQYDAAQHAVFWSLAELPPAKAGPVKLTTLPIEPGEQKLQVRAQADMGLSAAGEQVVQVEQAAELLHTVKDLDEVIEVGSETTYEIRVKNVGTIGATNVRVVALVPAGLAAIGGEGPTRAGGDASQVAFEPLPRLNPQEEVVYKVQVQGKQPGDHVVRVQLSSDDRTTPVTREESTRVYQDR